MWTATRSARTLTGGQDVFTFVSEQGLPPRAGSVLFQLYEVVHIQPTINYFEEPKQNLEKVLNIFIRVNQRGVTLSSSDLLLSVATAQWRHRDAPEVEDAWDGIDRSLRLAALTLSTFGFSATTLQANSVLIPVADYLHLRELTESAPATSLATTWVGFPIS